MHRSVNRIPGADIVEWLSPVGSAVRLITATINTGAFGRLSIPELRALCFRMGIQSFHFVVLASALVAICLTIECIIEMRKYQAQDLAGAVISLGLLREIGPMTISMAWCARVSAMVAEEIRFLRISGTPVDTEIADFFLARWIAALFVSIPLGAYGLMVGFLTGALFAPLIGANSTGDFLESARQAINMKDVVVYFIKLIAINPTVGVIAGCVAAITASDTNQSVADRAVTATFLIGFALNLAVTVVAYLVGEPNL